MAKSNSTAEKRKVEESKAVPQPGYFLSLGLENVRCFGPKQTLDLSDGHGKPAQWTVILGLNGTGKTTILQSLVLFERLRVLPPDLEKVRRIGRFFALHWEDKKTFPRSQQETATWTAKVAMAHTFADPPASVEENRFQIPGEGMGTGFSGMASPWCCGYGAGRRMGATSLSETGPGDPTASLFSDKADLRNPEEWLLWMDYAAAKPSQVKQHWVKRLAQVKELLLSILPEVEDLRPTTRGGAIPTSRVEFKTPFGWVPLRQLGYGYQTLITWVTDLASRMVERYPDSPDPLAEPAFVAVDEIDLHLHPVWQRKVMGYLTERFPNTQFVVTAHSPLVAQAAVNANLAVLRREGDHVIIDNDRSNIRNWRIDQILTSDLFGLETARPPQIERQLQERRKLLTKAKLTAADQRRLKELEAEIGDLPTGETAWDIKAMEEIRKSLDLLMNERRPGQ
jgi:hypothetical protein